MKTLVNNLAFRHAYQGFFLLLMIAIPNITLGMTTLYNNQTGLTFTSLESWGIIAVNLIIFYITYLWAKSEGLIHNFSLNRKDIKAIIWGFAIIFLMGLIGSNLMLLTHTNYHAELQKTLTTTPILPVLVSSGLFCLFHMPTNLAHLLLYIGMGLALSMVYQKRENLSASITLHVLWNLYTLCATILVMTTPM